MNAQALAANLHPTYLIPSYNHSLHSLEWSSMSYCLFADKYVLTGQVPSPL